MEQGHSCLTFLKSLKEFSQLATRRQIGYSDTRGDKRIALILRAVNDMGLVWKAVVFAKIDDATQQLLHPVTSTN